MCAIHIGDWLFWRRPIDIGRLLCDGRIVAQPRLQRGHNQQRDSINQRAVKQAVEIYTELGRLDDAAPVLGALGKAYLDKGDLDLAESSLSKALTIYRRRLNAQEEVTTINALFHLISERKQDSNSPNTYKSIEYDFSFIIPTGWLKQELVERFLSTGGQVAISHKSHKATFNVSVGTPDQAEWVAKDARAGAVRAFLSQTPGRIGAIAVSISTQVAGQSNTVCAEYVVQQDVNNASVKRKNGFISIIHNQLEYVIQWSAVHEYENQVNGIIASLKFGT